MLLHLLTELLQRKWRNITALCLRLLSVLRIDLSIGFIEMPFQIDCRLNPETLFLITTWYSVQCSFEFSWCKKILALKVR